MENWIFPLLIWNLPIAFLPSFSPFILFPVVLSRLQNVRKRWGSEICSGDRVECFTWGWTILNSNSNFKANQRLNKGIFFYHRIHSSTYASVLVATCVCGSPCLNILTASFMFQRLPTPHFLPKIIPKMQKWEQVTKLAKNVRKWDKSGNRTPPKKPPKTTTNGQKRSKGPKIARNSHK